MLSDEAGPGGPSPNDAQIAAAGLLVPMRPHRTHRPDRASAL